MRVLAIGQVIQDLEADTQIPGVGPDRLQSVIPVLDDLMQRGNAGDDSACRMLILLAGMINRDEVILRP